MTPPRRTSLKKPPAGSARPLRPEKTSVPAGMPASLNDEIAMLRVATRRAYELFSRLADAPVDDPESQPPLKEITSILGALGLASIRVSSLLRTQAALSGGDPHARAAVSEALSQIYREWKL